MLEYEFSFYSLKLNKDITQNHKGPRWQSVTLSPPTSEIGVLFPARPQVGKLVVGWQFTVQNLDQLYVLVSSALTTIRRDMTCTVLKVMQNPK